MAGLGGPWGRMKRKNTISMEIAALMTMRRVICRLAMTECAMGFGAARRGVELWIFEAENGARGSDRYGQGLR